MAGIAAGLGALGEGFVRGVKIGSDLADAETRRGLMDQQIAREKAQIEKEKTLSDLRTQIANEVASFKPAGPDDTEGFNAYYDRLKPLMMKQAALSGVDPLLVEQSIDDKRKSKYAERLYTALGDIQAGNPVGFEKLKPVYNQMFKDKGTLIGGAYDQKTDSVTMNFTAPGDESGKPQSMTLPREAFVKQAFAYLNTSDAIRFETQDLARQASERRKEAFESGENEKNRGLKRDLSKEDNAAAERRTIISGEYGLKAAGARASVGSDEKVQARYEKNYDDFRKDLGTAFGYDPKNPLQPKDALENFNKSAAAATNIWKATSKSGANLSASEVRQVMEAVSQGKEKTINEKDGWRLVEVGSIKAVVPALK